MSPIRDQLMGVIDALPEKNQALLLEIARLLFDRDDEATPDDLKDIDVARSEYASGKTVPHAAINWD